MYTLLFVSKKGYCFLKIKSASSYISTLSSARAPHNSSGAPHKVAISTHRVHASTRAHSSISRGCGRRMWRIVAPSSVGLKGASAP